MYDKNFEENERKKHLSNPNQLFFFCKFSCRVTISIILYSMLLLLFFLPKTPLFFFHIFKHPSFIQIGHHFYSTLQKISILLFLKKTNKALIFQFFDFLLFINKISSYFLKKKQNWKLLFFFFAFLEIQFFSNKNQFLWILKIL